MSLPVLLITSGTRAELLEAAPILRALRHRKAHELPFRPLWISSGQEDTELQQAQNALDLEPDKDLQAKQHRQADAQMNADLLSRMEGIIRQTKAAVVLTVGCSSTAWATAVACWIKQVPLIHLGAGVFCPDGIRPRPEWLHRQALARTALLHLCPDNTAARSLLELLSREPEDNTPSMSGWGGPQVKVVGWGNQHVLTQSLQTSAEAAEDPILSDIPKESPRVLVYIRRREHHAENLAPIAQAIIQSAEKRPDVEFIVVHSLQSFICDTWKALLPGLKNLRGISPLPHPVFVRELARANLVVTDSTGVCQEVCLLQRPLIMLGAYAQIESLQAAFSEQDQNQLITGVAELSQSILQSLDNEPAQSRPSLVSDSDSGEKVLEMILEWWQHNEQTLERKS